MTTMLRASTVYCSSCGHGVSLAGLGSATWDEVYDLARELHPCGPGAWPESMQGAPDDHDGGVCSMRFA